MDELDKAMELARETPRTPEQRRAQMIRFSHGNLAIENPDTSRATIERLVDEALTAESISPQ